MSRINLNANSLAWDHHPHPPLRRSILAQAGTSSPCPSQVTALQPGLCPRLRVKSHVSCYSFPPGLHQLLSSATPDQTTRWTLGLTDSFVLSGPAQRSDPQGLCQGQEKHCRSHPRLPACPSLQSSPALAAPGQTSALKDL